MDYDATKFRRRKIDFYIRGLHVFVRQDLFRKMDKLNPISLERLLEKPDGYPCFHRMHYTEKEIKDYIARIKVEFEEVNAFMIEHGRYPLFTITDDLYLACQEYFDIMKMRPLQELEEEFGCRLQDYVPRVRESLSESVQL